MENWRELQSVGPRRRLYVMGAGLYLKGIVGAILLSVSQPSNVPACFSRHPYLAMLPCRKYKSNGAST